MDKSFQRIYDSEYKVKKGITPDRIFFGIQLEDSNLCAFATPC